MGSAEERSSGSSLVGPAGEEVAQLAAARQFPTVPHNGNKPQATSQSAASWSYLCGGAASRYQSQPAPHIQHGTTTFSYCSRIKRPGIPQPQWAYCEISRDVGVGFRKEGEEMIILCAICSCQRGNQVLTLDWGGRQAAGILPPYRNLCNVGIFSWHSSQGFPHT